MSAPARLGTRVLVKERKDKDEAAEEEVQISIPEYIAIPQLDAAALQAAADAKQLGSSLKAGATSSREVEEAGQNPYWMRSCRYVNSPMLRLHQGTGRRGREVLLLRCSGQILA